MTQLFFRSIFFLMLIGLSTQAWSQGNNGRPSNPNGVAWDTMDYYDATVTFGRFLPFGIVGVRDNYPMWGVMFSHPSPLGLVEYQFYRAKAEGVTIYSGVFGLRWDFSLYDAIDGFFGIGADAYYYQRKPTSRREFDFVSSGGTDLKWGAYFPIADALRLRSDFKFNVGPGKTFFVGIGLQYRWGGGQSN
jgi:hypothetical protein